MKEEFGLLASSIIISNGGRFMSKLLKIIFALASVIVFISIYDFPKKIDSEYSAVEFQVGNPESAEVTKIKIIGTLTDPFFGESTFKGDIIIDTYDFTKSYKLMDFIFPGEDFTTKAGTLSYTSIKDGKPVGEMLGLILKSGDFKQLAILVNREKPEENFPKKVISAPATNYEEALEIYEKLKEQ
jgi:hypothetical protein